MLDQRNLQPVNILFSSKSEQKFSSVLNSLLLQARCLIFYCKVAEQTLNIQNCISC